MVRSQKFNVSREILNGKANKDVSRETYRQQGLT